MPKTLCIIIDYITISDFTDINFMKNTQMQIENFALSQKIRCIVISAQTTQEVFSQILKNGENYENFLIFHSNMPFLFIDLSKQVLTRHQELLVDYTFVEYVPIGLAPFAISLEVLNIIMEAIPDIPYNALVIDNYLKQDLNQYDLEIILPDGDYRFLKQDFLITDKRSYLLFTKILAENPVTNTVKEFLNHTIHLFRTAPTFLDISLIAETQPQAVFQAPTSNAYQIDITYLKAFIQEIINQNPNITIQFNLQSGDPFNYLNISDVLDLVKEFEQTSFIIETLGNNIGIFIEKISSLKNLKTILYLSAASQNILNTIQPNQNIKELEELAEKLFQINPHQTYLQWVRMNDNEAELPLFLERWGAYKEHIIISQYNNFLGALPDKKVVDFAPLKRFPCFRLAKDLFIRANGEISLCSMDINNKYPLNININTVDYTLLYDKLGKIYREHFSQKWNHPCEKCDYWYIFNL